MNESGKELIFSENVKAGRRIYYFDVKQSRNGDKYIAITESKKISDGDQETPHFTFEKHKLFLYKEDYEKFTEALQKAIAVAKGEQITIKENYDTDSDNPTMQEENNYGDLSDDSLKIDLDF
ncbi:MAG: PUR family DNA/RNA-binding protein [Bacteroides sp.]|nr:PUR family DNA/RNA-binding protein [Roseburia sp.]MCM1346988.1 PUR family DNA/RNA-binding protein [Bacteroides sp.]MCM1421540.1 PUR family DNA/RNA-binding protein [Bacteroides sp.]